MHGVRDLMNMPLSMEVILQEKNADIHLFPALYLLLRPDARNMLSATCTTGDEHALRDEESSGNNGALLVVLHGDVFLLVLQVRPEPRQRRHDNAMLESDVANFDGLEEFRGRHGDEDGEGFGKRVHLDEESEDEDEDLISASPPPPPPAILKIGPSLLGRPNPSAFARRKWATAESTPEPSAEDPTPPAELHISTDEDSDLPVTPDDISIPVGSASDEEGFDGEEVYYEDGDYGYDEVDTEMDLIGDDEEALRPKSVTHSSHHPVLPLPKSCSSRA